MKASVQAERPASAVALRSQHLPPVTGLAVTADGKLLASASEDSRVILWRLTGGNVTFALPLQHPAEVYAVAAGPKVGEAYQFLTGCADGKGRLWIVPVGKLREVFELADANGHTSAIRAVAFSRDGKRRATGGDDRQICIWDVE